jgi:hypothetical protein
LRIGAPYRWPSQSWGQAQWSDYLADPAREYWIVRHTGEVGLVPEYVAAKGIGGNAVQETCKNVS